MMMSPTKTLTSISNRGNRGTHGDSSLILRLSNLLSEKPIRACHIGGIDMAYTKPLVTTTVYYHGGADPIVFADAVDNGKTVRYGSNARAELLACETVEEVGTIGVGDATKYVIPYHAVIFATVTKADSESLEKPEDAFCVTE